MSEIHFYALLSATQFPGDVTRCGECCAIVHDADTTSHAAWHEHIDNRFIKAAHVGESVTVVPVDEPTLYERILTTLADRAVDLEAAAKRCDAVERPGLAIEHRTGAEAVRMDLVAVIGLSGVNRDVSTNRANALIAEAAKRRG